MKSSIKAGLIGAALAILFSVILRVAYFIPGISRVATSLITELPFLMIYLAVGVLAAHWLPAPKTIRQGVFAGALAGLIMGILDSMVSIFLDTLLQVFGLTEAYYQLDQYFNNVLAYMVFVGYLFCWASFWLFIGIILSGLGGLSYGLIKKRPPDSW